MLSLAVWCVVATLPPHVGKSFAASFAVPLIGWQHVTLHVHSRQDATIELRGVINADGDTSYRLRNDGIVDFELSPTLQGLMQRYRCSIEFAAFDAKRNDATLRLRIRPLRLSKHLRLMPTARA